ncbi:hypothetical protein P5673_018977 [Acropora cervicornis]|uniref:Uncharacterized protein n=1 Tax=Acropora cervicornis TaxID=6130 RepID=A0AAD9V2I0_ACRCE|nr:hypothetical protein P5673_018977 [Acropora cervicornis]
MRELVNKDKISECPRYAPADNKNAEGKMFENIEDVSSFWIQLSKKNTCKLDTTEATKVLARKKKWSALGPDRQTNFSWKKAKVLHESVAMSFQTIANTNIEYPVWFSEGKTTRLGTLRKIDDQFHKDDLSVRTSFSQSAKKEFTRNILIAIDLEKSDCHHFGSLSTARSRRRSYLNGKLNYSCNSHACFQLHRHVISGDIQPNPGPVLGHKYSCRENIPTRKLKLSCWSLNARSVANKGRELISRLTYKPCDLVAITETWLDQSTDVIAQGTVVEFCSHVILSLVV